MVTRIEQRDYREIKQNGEKVGEMTTTESVVIERGGELNLVKSFRGLRSLEDNPSDTKVTLGGGFFPRMYFLEIKTAGEQKVVQLRGERVSATLYPGDRLIYSSDDDINGREVVIEHLVDEKS